MKTALPIFIFLSFYTAIFSQTTPKDAEKIATFCKVWGFLKYYHPTVAKGKHDWDKEFITRINALNALNTKQEVSNYYMAWISSLGEVKKCKKCKEAPDSLKVNLDLKWLSDTTQFTAGLIDQLQYIQHNRNQGKNYYVQKYFLAGNPSFEHEKAYKDSVFPSVELRLLGLARYWNIINYFYPYKYGIGQDWNNVLTEMIPKFRDPKDTMDYHLAMLELTVKIKDSHSYFVTKYTNRHFGFYWVPFNFKLIDNKAIADHLFNDSLCKKDDIKYGDVFLKVNGSPIDEILKAQWKYIEGSNDATKLRNTYYCIFNGATDSVKVTYERDGVTAEKIIHRYTLKDVKHPWDDGISKEKYKILDGNIGYVNMGQLDPKDVSNMMAQLKNTKGIIFDVRNYPRGTMFRIARYLNTDYRNFVHFTLPDISYPGVFKHDEGYGCGKKNNKDAYKGKIVLLFNEETQSHAEFTLMALQTAPNVTGIGSQTAGADGNVSPITFPGGYKTYMTGLGVYYPDGRETQRVGIVPDIEIKPTIAGIRLKKDEVLDKAIEVINRK